MRHKNTELSSLHPLDVRYRHDHPLPVLLRWSSDVSAGRCSPSQTGRRHCRARLQTPAPPRVCSDDKFSLFKLNVKWWPDHVEGKWTPPRILHKLLNQHHVIVEGFSGLASRRLQLLQKVGIWRCDAHTLHTNPKERILHIFMFLWKQFDLFSFF